MSINEGGVTQGSEAPSQDTGTVAPTSNQGSDSGYSEFAAGLLKDVPDNHRVLLEPYVKQWDSGVTKRFQEQSEKYKPYEELGDIEFLRTAATVARMIEESPEEVYKLLHEEFGQQQQQPDTQQQQNLLGGGSPEIPEELAPYLSPFQQQMQQQQQLLTQLTEYVLKNHQASESQKADQELENTLQGLRKEHGDFDESYVLTRMLNGETPEQAMKAFLDLKQSLINQASQGRSLPPVLSGGGAPPMDNMDVTKMSKDQIKQLIANSMAQASQSDRG